MCCKPNNMLLAAAAAGRASNMLAAAHTEVGALTCNALGGRGTCQLTCYTFGSQKILVACNMLVEKYMLSALSAI